MAAAAGCCLRETAIGRIGLAWTAEGRIQAVQLPEPDDAATLARLRHRAVGAPEAEPPSAVQAVAQRLQAALAGRPDPLLDVALDEEGIPDFARRVYALTRAIPPGEVRRYGDLAAALGAPGAARAVGQALGANPFAPLVPCHRVLAAGGGAGGFSATGGTRTKLRLLQIEGASLRDPADGPGLFD
jgi:methylated-DNA-[protein]-cysteine S-methyltransferase